MLHIHCYDFPIGTLWLAGDDAGLTNILFDGQSAPKDAVEGETPLLCQAARELSEYFLGKRKEFSVPLHPRGTEFQRSVWAALQTIPYGQTVSYKQIAARLGNPNATRAVGGANGKNPIPIIIPCHRVIAADGTLGGYSLGLELKQRLLDLEREHT